MFGIGDTEDIQRRKRQCVTPPPAKQRVRPSDGEKTPKRRREKKKANELSLGPRKQDGIHTLQSGTKDPGRQQLGGRCNERGSQKRRWICASRNEKQK